MPATSNYLTGPILERHFDILLFQDKTSPHLWRIAISRWMAEASARSSEALETERVLSLARRAAIDARLICQFDMIATSLALLTKPNGPRK
jgi:hypothetical protein